jgi:signal transduction histidine kinase/DNA-binding response OmpR family regulator
MSTNGTDPELSERMQSANTREQVLATIGIITAHAENVHIEAMRHGRHDLELDINRILAATRDLTNRVERLIDADTQGTWSTRGLHPVAQQALRHELRTPLNAIKGYGEILQEDLATLRGTPLQAAVDHLVSAANDLLVLFDRMVALAVRKSRPGATGEEAKTAVTSDNPRKPQRSPRDRDASSTALQSGTILIVDDNEANRDLLSRRLTRDGYRVSIAVGGRAALDALADADFDLVLLDLMMPDINGLEVLQRIKADVRLRMVPVIMITASAEMDSAIHCIEAGAEDYLPKPFDPVLLRARIGACLEKKRWRDREQDYLRRLEAHTKELQDSLKQQTATSELLKVIGRSIFDLQSVFDLLVEYSVKLCESEHAFILRFDGRVLRLVAHHNVLPDMKAYVERHPITPGLGSGAGRAVLERRTIHIPDIRNDPEYTYYGTLAVPLRTVLSVPMLRGDEVLGVIAINRHEVRPFSNNQIALMETFADQAVIAIENVRLFEEVQARTQELAHSVAELRALGEVSQAVNSTIDLETVLATIVAKAVQLSDTDAGTIYVLHETSGEFEPRSAYGMDEALIAGFKTKPIRIGDKTVVDQATVQRVAVQIADVQHDDTSRVHDSILRAGFRALLTIPLLGVDRIVGALVVRRKRPGEFPKETIELLQTFAAQSVLAIQNARLFHEIEQKSHELEIASQHKSQFVAHMSHELRTPLAAMLGYAELLQEGIYDALPAKSLPILARIESNGKHLLGLINTVLDISKIEAGQFKLNLAEYALGAIVETVLVATESLAATKKLGFKTEVAKGLPYGIGDEQRLTQVLLNLVGNAIKFTDTGEVRIAAGATNGQFELSVSDTGPGIPPEECERIFEKFRQVDSSITRAKGGTGLGLAIAREIVEMHGGRIWVESRMGQGSTFRLEFPMRAAAAGAT